MKKFVFKLGLAITLLSFCYYGTLYVLLAQEQGAYNTSITLPRGHKFYICLSDSLTVYGLNPEFWPDLINMSSEASSLDCQLMKLIDILEKNPETIQGVLLDINLLRLFGEKKRITVNADKEGAKFYPLYLWHPDQELQGVILDKSSIASNWLRFKCKELIKGNLKSELVQGYLFRDDTIIISRPEQSLAEAIDYAELCNSFSKNSQIDEMWSMQILDKMVLLCKEKNVNVFLLSLPLPRLVLERIEPKTIVAFNKCINKLSLEHNVPYLNYLRMKLDDSCFININHLNYNGSRIITNLLKDSIENSY